MAGNIIVVDNITPAMREMAKDYPGVMRGALKNLGQRWRRIISEQMREGVVAGVKFPDYDAITKRAKRQRELGIVFNRVAGLKSLRKQARAEGVAKTSLRAHGLRERKKQITTAFQDLGFGGRLSRLTEGYASDNLKFGVGFLGKQFPTADRSAARWMRNEQRAFTKGERRWLHGLLKSDSIPSRYLRKERPPVAPQEKNFQEDANVSLEKSVKARIAAIESKRLARNA